MSTAETSAQKGPHAHCLESHEASRDRLQQTGTAVDGGLQVVRLDLAHTMDSQRLDAIAAANGALDTAMQPRTMHLGPVETRTDIPSSLDHFHHLPEYQVRYPQSVLTALGDLYAEYNAAFAQLVEANREWPTDYQYCMRGDGKGTPHNFFVQIDMVALPEDFLEQAQHMDPSVVREVLRGRIFEIENSLAMYNFMNGVFSRDGTESKFSRTFRASLDELRQTHGKKIAVLAVTDAKYKAMKEAEYGVMNGDELTDERVRELAGFDRVFSPDAFAEHVRSNGGKSDYLLYVRSSDPVVKLKDPRVRVDVPLLQDDDMRRVIKANALTFNVDAPDMDAGRRINDTKGYLRPMGMAYDVGAETDVYTAEVIAHTQKGKKFADFQGEVLTPSFVTYLTSIGINPADVVSGKVLMRAKPGKGFYGCYGHVRGPVTDRDFRGGLRAELKKRGVPYVMQPEMANPVVTDDESGKEYTIIDRNMFSFTGEKPVLMSGFRSFMPADTQEAKEGRNHGNGSTVWAEISGE